MKKSLLIGVFLVLLLLVGCSNNEQSKGEEVKQEVKQEQKQASEIKQNKDLTKKVKEEDGVLDGQVYEQNGMVFATFILDTKVSDKKAKTLVNNYVKELEKKYKDKKVNVQAVRDGKNVANNME